MLRLKQIGWILAVMLVIALAAYEGGPHAAGDSRLATVFGAQALEPVPEDMPPCNGTGLVEELCPVDARGFPCGERYMELRPVLPGAVKNKLFDNDRRVCTRYYTCPRTYSKKEVMRKCREVVHQGDE